MRYSSRWSLPRCSRLFPLSIIRHLRTWGTPRVPSALLTVILALALLAGIAGTVAFQVAHLAQDLPQYEANLRSKIRGLGAGPWTSPTLDRATDTLRDLQDELAKTRPSSAEPKPLLVEVRQPELRGLEAIAQLVRPLLTPLATSALVVLFLVFILLQREDLRDRFLRLAGTADLQRTTAALDDAASRLSRFFLAQTLLNTSLGVVIASGLWVIGVPNAVIAAFFGAATQPAHVRIIARRVRRLMPRAQILACFWMLGARPSELTWPPRLCDRQPRCRQSRFPDAGSFMRRTAARIAFPPFGKAPRAWWRRSDAPARSRS